MIVRHRPSTRLPLDVALVLLAAILASPGFARAQASFEVLHAFDGRLDLEVPSTAISEGADGDFYVTTARGGRYRHGSIFRMTPSGVATVLHSFSGGADGSTPLGSVIQASDGNLYGTTEHGGSGGLGTVFKVAPDGTLTTLHAFTGRGSDGAYPRASLIQAADGNFYGTTTQGGEEDYGTVFRMTPDGEVALVHSFTGSDGAYPEAALIQATDGQFYGSTSRGGLLEWTTGTFFAMTSTGVVTSWNYYWFDDQAYGPVVQANDGSFYRTTITYDSWASVFRFYYEPGYGRVQGLVASFYPAATGPIGAFIQAIDGDFYGTTSRDGSFGHGRVFKMNAAGVVTTQHEFPSGRPDAFIQASDGNFYGTTSGDVTSEIGTVFKMTADGAVIVLHTFTGSPEGANPSFPLIEAVDGNFYGTMPGGGRFGRGTAFRMTPSGDVTELHAFGGGTTDGASPSSALIQAPDGYFYGTTSSGGAFDGGTFFRMTAAGVVTILHAFAGGVADGLRPYAALVHATDGNVYGVTRKGGTFDGGTAFRMTLDGRVTILHAFGADDGTVGAFLQARDGNFYGTAARGCAGRVFRMSLDGTVTTLHSIDLLDGDYSCLDLPGIIQARDGNLYGTTFGDWKGARGTFYKVTLKGKVTVVRTFDPEQFLHVALMIQATDGNFYGANDFGYAAGGFWKITHDGLVTLVPLDGPTEGSGLTAFLQASDGNFYGTTRYGGPFLSGVAFRLRVMPAAPTSVNVVALSGQVRLTWSSTVRATSYTVKRSIGAGGETVLARGITSTSYVDTSAKKGQTYYYVVSAVNAFGESLNSYEVSMTAGRATIGDFDGDGTTDPSVFRPSDGNWFILKPSTNPAPWNVYPVGQIGDLPVPGDYDGDGKTDVSVYRPSTGTWFILKSSTNYTAWNLHDWGEPGDVPLPGDYDGDEKSDVAVYRPSDGIWFILKSSTNFTTYNVYKWGEPGDVPLPGDYDGDGKTDVAVYRPSDGTWFALKSSTNFTAYDVLDWGEPGDVPLPGDYDGDGKTDVAVYRPSNGIWFILKSSTHFTTWNVYDWGEWGDVPLPGDFDGDGRTDVTVYRPSDGHWFILKSGTNFTSYTVHDWGEPGDIPAVQR